MYVFLVQGVASPASKFRAGARHAMVIYATGNTIIEARERAVGTAQDHCWMHVEVVKQSEMGRDIQSIDNDVLKSAAKSALEEGASIVVYLDEIPLDA